MFDGLYREGRDAVASVAFESGLVVEVMGVSDAKGCGKETGGVVGLTEDVDLLLREMSSAKKVNLG